MVYQLICPCGKIFHPPELAPKAFLSMYRFLLRIEKIDEGLATCALRAICNMLEKPTNRICLLSDQRVA